MKYKTIPEMFYTQAAKNKDNVIQRYKKNGQWLDITWNEAKECVEAFAQGLIKLGINPKIKGRIAFQSTHK